MEDCMSWINFMGLIIMASIMIANIVYAILLKRNVYSRESPIAFNYIQDIITKYTTDHFFDYFGIAHIYISTTAIN